MAQYSAVVDIGSSEALRKEVLRFVGELEFETFSLTTIFEVGGGELRSFSIDNTPDAYRGVYEDPHVGRTDPVAQFCKHRSEPIAWDQSTYTRAGKGDRWEHQAKFGYRTGMAMALHLSPGRHLFFGVDRDKTLPRCSKLIAQKLASLTLFAVLANDPAFSILSPTSTFHTEMASLTQRELESLRWTMEGKTAWEVGRILGISEQTVARHLNKATHKLGCANKHHAVVKALRIGLLR
jgi:DNA-binding CsgD family transcriptional regulator